MAQKLADGQLALFVAAGLSRQAIANDGSGRRLPLWKELAQQVAAACHEDLDAYGGNVLDLFDAIELGQSRFTLEQAVRASLDDEAFDPSPACRAAVGGRLHDELQRAARAGPEGRCSRRNSMIGCSFPPTSGRGCFTCTARWPNRTR